MSADRPSHTLYLVDGTSQLYRAYFAINGLTNAEGMPTNAVYGFTTMLRKLLRDEKPTYLAVAFDLRGPVFRHESYAEYKANRPPTPDDLRPQIPYAKQVCAVLGIPVLEQQGYEADDLIATFTSKARAEGLDVVIVASDKDLLQLVEDGVIVLNPSKELRLDAKGVEATFGVPPERVSDVLGLMGDAVDNVPGVPGVGRKTALAIAATYGDLEVAITRAERFVEAFDSRDRVVAAIDAVKAETSLRGEVAAECAEAAAQLAGKLAALREVERDAEFDARIEAAETFLRADAVESVALSVGQPGKVVARGLSELRRELKGLDRGSGKRVWCALRDHADQARLSKQLVTLESHVPVELTPADLVRSEGDPSGARQLFRELGFTSLVDDAEGESVAVPADSPAIECTTVLDEEALGRLVAACRAAERVAIHVATDDGGALRCGLIGLALAHDEGRAAYIPLAHQYLGVPAQLPLDRVRDALGPLLADATLPKVAHDLKRTIHVLRRNDLLLEGCALDTMVAAFLLDSSRSAYALDLLAGEWLGLDLVPVASGAEGAAGVEVETAALRATAAAEAIHRLAGRLRDRLESSELATLYDEIDGPLLPLLARMEARGVRVDTDQLARMSSEMEIAIERLRGEIHELAGVEFNVDSPKQLREILFERLGLEARRKTAKSKAASTDAQTLEELADEHAIAGKLLEYRELTKLKGTYVDALPRLVHPETGRIHTSYDPTGAATGRLSSSDPNLQNIPVRKEAGRRIRAAFVPDEGFVFLASDYSQVELRVLAHVAEDPQLIAAFRAGEDIHRHTAARVFEVLPDLVTDDMRRRAKAVNFGVLYGMSDMRLAREQGISRREARRFIQAYFERFDRVRAYIDGVRERALAEAVVHTMFGRVRRFPQLHQKINHAVREQALRAAVNTTIQGSAADLMKQAMLAVERELIRSGLAARMLLQVHDELLLEVPLEELEATRVLVRDAMEGVGRLLVPLAVDQKIGPSWLEAT